MSEPAAPGPSVPSSRLRSATTGVALLVPGSLLLLFAAGRRWLSGTVAETGAPVVHVWLNGHSVTGAPTAFGLLGLAGAATTLLLRGWARRVVGGLLCVGMIVGAVSLAGSWNDPAARVREAAGVANGVTHAVVSPWPVLAFAAALLAAAGSFQLGFASGTRARTAAPAPSTDLWSAIDRGEDPTG